MNRARDDAELTVLLVKIHYKCFLMILRFLLIIEYLDYFTYKLEYFSYILLKTE